MVSLNRMTVQMYLSITPPSKEPGSSLSERVTGLPYVIFIVKIVEDQKGVSERNIILGEV